jgi:hypothetical protein
LGSPERLICRASLIARSADAGVPTLGYVGPVERRFSRSPVHGPRADAALAALLTCLAQVEIWILGDPDGSKC